MSVAKSVLGKRCNSRVYVKRYYIRKLEGFGADIK